MFNCDVFVVTEEDGERYASSLNDIKIRLSKHLIKNSRILDNILLHEMIHYYGYLMNEDIEGSHGKFFKKMARKINKDGYNVQKYYKED
jgi:predicted SprT family Zn-dependent metalloprotease